MLEYPLYVRDIVEIIEIELGLRINEFRNDLIMLKQSRWAGHVARMKNDR
jgi:hypothetical protein